jgi:hypothetical protein
LGGFYNVRRVNVKPNVHHMNADKSRENKIYLSESTRGGICPKSRLNDVNANIALDVHRVNVLDLLDREVGCRRAAALLDKTQSRVALASPGRR